ncbi:MAG: hypothetical protein M1467_04440 [Deltaproteobacteria bacterium]|nr:hypothetical protein [Deltaproteobacteria bacterium]
MIINTLRYAKRPKRNEPRYGKSRLGKLNLSRGFSGKITAHPLWMKGNTVVIKVSSSSKNLYRHLIYTQVMRAENGKENPLWNDEENIERKEFLKEFRGKGHEKYYKVMISPENIYDEDEIKRIVKKTIQVINEKYHDEPVYGAVIHRKPRGLHAHIVVRSKTKKERYIDFRKQTHLLERMKVAALEETSRIAKEKEKEKKLNLEIDELIYGKDYLTNRDREIESGNAYQAIR